LNAQRRAAVASIVGLTLLAIMSFLLAWWFRKQQRPTPRPTITVTFLELSSGSCALIRTPDKRTILINDGGIASGAEVVRTLKKAHITQVDLLVLASPSLDEIGGTTALLDSRIPIKSIWNSAVDDGDPTRQKLIQRMRLRRIPYRVVHSNEKTTIGESAMRLAVLWPPQRSPRASLDPLICRLEFGQTAILLAGSCNSAAEPYLVADANDTLACDILQVPGNGGADCASLEFMRLTGPATAVISSTPQAPPDPGTLHRLQAAGAGIWRTDMQGAITVTANGVTAPQVTGAKL
jgi:competence protein ComEC